MLIWGQMESLKIKTKSAGETKAVAQSLAGELSKSRLNHALVVALSGDLGGGKTTFAQGFAKGLGIKDKVASPTFLIQKTYRLKKAGYSLFTHMDAYRLKNAEEIVSLGWKELARNQRAIILVEWAKNIKKILPKIHIDIHFDVLPGEGREITILNHVKGK